MLSETADELLNFYKLIELLLNSCSGGLLAWTSWSQCRARTLGNDPLVVKLPDEIGSFLLSLDTKTSILACSWLTADWQLVIHSLLGENKLHNYPHSQRRCYECLTAWLAKVLSCDGPLKSLVAELLTF